MNDRAYERLIRENRELRENVRRLKEELDNGFTVWAIRARQLDYLIAENTRLRDALTYARNELDRHGYGDFHYGETPREPSIVAALAIVDSALRGYEVTDVTREDIERSLDAVHKRVTQIPPAVEAFQSGKGYVG